MALHRAGLVPCLLCVTRMSTRRFSGIAMSSAVTQAIDSTKFAEAKQLAISARFPHQLPLNEYLMHAGLLGQSVYVPGTPRDPSLPVIVDVRSPCEYAKGHIPGAMNVPLFTDEERAIIGTLYKHEGHDVAVKRGCAMIEASWRSLVDSLPSFVSPGDELLVYCKRGGMRSGGFAWLLSQAPINVRMLEGGYQGFRRWAREEVFQTLQRELVILGGRTGSGKTDVLLKLRNDCGAQVLDLEGDANHRGSTFGALGLPPQPSNEMYENRLALQWATFSPDKPVFIEDEGAHVGRCSVPLGLWALMRADNANVLRLDVPRATRIARLVDEYGSHSAEELAACVMALRKKLGQKRATHMASLLEQDPPELAEVADLLLTHYYDSMYEYQAGKRPGKAELFKCDTADPLQAAERVLDFVAAHATFSSSAVAGS